MLLKRVFIGGGGGGGGEDCFTEMVYNHAICPTLQLLHTSVLSGLLSSYPAACEAHIRLAGADSNTHFIY